MSKEDFINAMVLDAERGFYHAEEETQYEFQKEWEREQNTKRVRRKGKILKKSSSPKPLLGRKLR